MLTLALSLQPPSSSARPPLPPAPLPPRYVVVPGPPAQGSFQATLEGLAAGLQVRGQRFLRLTEYLSRRQIHSLSGSPAISAYSAKKQLDVHAAVCAAASLLENSITSC